MPVPEELYTAALQTHELLVTSTEAVGRTALLGSFKNLDIVGGERVRGGDLGSEDFGRVMQMAALGVLQLNEAGLVKPKLTDKQVTTFRQRAGEDSAPAQDAAESSAQTEPAAGPTDLGASETTGRKGGPKTEL